jgi:hypothetical protein
MVQIIEPSLGIKRLANSPNWEISVEYTAAFAPNELNIEFTDAIKIWEWDEGEAFGGGNDVIKPYEPTHEKFRPQTQTVFRRRTRMVTTDDLNTESGVERIRAQVWLGNNPVPPGNFAEVFTGIHGLDV